MILCMWTCMTDIFWLYFGPLLTSTTSILRNCLIDLSSELQLSLMRLLQAQLLNWPHGCTLEFSQITCDWRNSGGTLQLASSNFTQITALGWTFKWNDDEVSQNLSMRSTPLTVGDYTFAWLGTIELLSLEKKSTLLGFTKVLTWRLKTSSVNQNGIMAMHFYPGKIWLLFLS